jgi:beta-lactamase regulating signal transducer with metallopeptidase domain/5-hydroxyisourate hydrolase-like protein (transthyretin family)
MSLIDSLFGPIAWFSVVACVVLGLAALVTRGLVQPLERVRVIQCSFAILLLATLFSLGEWGPSIPIPVLPAVDVAFESNEAAPAFMKPARSLGEETGEPLGPRIDAMTDAPADAGAAAAPAAAPAVVWNWVMWCKRAAVALFLWVSAVLLGGYALGQFLARRIVRSSSTLAEAVANRATQILARLAPGASVRVASSPSVSAPMVFGVWSPTIVLPAEIVEPSADPILLAHCVAHEWAHIERRDLLTWNLVSLCQPVLWPQPFYWWLRRELRVNQDHLADEYAAHTTGERLVYAESLVDLAQRGSMSLLGGLTMAGRRSNVFRRVERLLNDSLPILPESRRPIVIAVAALMACVGVVATSLRGAPAAAADEKPAAAVQANHAPAADAKPVAGSVEHSGQVLDLETKAPIAGATVVCTRLSSKDWTELAITESKTDANGRYTFSIPPEQLKDRFLYLLFDLRHEDYAPVHCGSYSYSMIQRNLTVGDQPWFTKLHMVPGVVLSGRLVDDKNRPVAGAQLRAESGKTDLNANMLGSFMSAVSDADGRFQVSVTKKGEATLKVIPLEHCMEVVKLGEKRDALGDIRLTAGRPLKGKVVDSAGAPVPNVWVNLSEGTRGQYELQRSARTNERGEFETRPIRLGKCFIEVETKATGAIEKERYANFHDEPTPAVFVGKVIDVTEESIARPVTVQAVPHVVVTGSYVNAKGEPCYFHEPEVFGRVDEGFFSAKATRDAKTGEFKLMLPRGLRDARLQFMTNEHTALRVQMPGKPMVARHHFMYPVMNDDIIGIKVIRYTAPLLVVTVVDENDQPVADADIRLTYPADDKADPSPSIGSVSFEKQGDGVSRSSSLCPGIEFVVTATKGELKSEPKTMTLAEGVTERVTMKLAKP